MLQWELEEYKAHTQEQMERLNQQLREIDSELFAKDAELKRLKLVTSNRNSVLKASSIRA